MPITTPARIKSSATTGKSVANATEGIAPADLNKNAMISGCARPTPSQAIITPKSILFVDLTGHPCLTFFATGGIRTLALHYSRSGARNHSLLQGVLLPGTSLASAALALYI